MKKKTENYLVVVSYSFDSETEIYEFSTREKAREFMRLMWEICTDSERKIVDTELDEAKTVCREEEDYAVLTWSDGDTKEWLICQPTTEHDAFREWNEKKQARQKIYAYREEDEIKRYSEYDLRCLWQTEIDQSNFADFDAWKAEMLRMQILTIE